MSSVLKYAVFFRTLEGREFGMWVKVPSGYPVQVEEREKKNESRADFEEILSIFSFSFPEPMGSKAPAFLGDVKSFFFLRKENTEVSLLCNAQGHPVPVTRYYITFS